MIISGKDDDLPIHAHGGAARAAFGPYRNLPCAAVRMTICQFMPMAALRGRLLAPIGIYHAPL
jgi:hypothetical protein